MSFDLNITDFNSAKQIQLIDQQNGTLITLQSKGALMNQWIVHNESDSAALILGNEKAEDFEMNGFRSGKMSPFSCRIAEGKYHWEDHLYQFEKFYLGVHAMHGLVYDANFLLQSTELQVNFASATLSLAYQGTDPGYPFPFDLLIQWTLFQDNLVEVKTTMINQSNSRIPVMDGWHPYFTLGGSINDYLLEFHTKGKLTMHEDMIPTGTILEENNFEKGLLIGSTHYDDCFLLDPIKNKIKLSYQGKSITIQPLYNYPYLQIYTPDDRKSIAIENLSGAPNCFNNKMGLHILEPHAQISFATRYQFSTASPQ